MKSQLLVNFPAIFEEYLTITNEFWQIDELTNKSDPTMQVFQGKMFIKNKNDQWD